MSLDPITAALDIGGKLLDKFFPDPSQRAEAELKLLEMKNNGELAKIAAETEIAKIDAGDRDSARHLQIDNKSKVPGFLSLLITIGFFSILGWMLKYGAPKEGGEALFIMLGSLGTAWGQCISFYFGSSASSENKTRMMVSMSQK